MTGATDGPAAGRSDGELDQLVRDALGGVSEERFRAMVTTAVEAGQHEAAEPVDRAGPQAVGPIARPGSDRARSGGSRRNLRQGLLAAAAVVAVVAGAVVVLGPRDRRDDVAGPSDTGSSTTAVAGPTAPTGGGSPCALASETAPSGGRVPDAPTIPRREFRCTIRVPGADRAPGVVLFDDGRLVAGLAPPDLSSAAGGSGWGCIEFGDPPSGGNARTTPSGPGATVDGGVILDREADRGEGSAARLDYGGATCDGSGLTVTPVASGSFELPYRVRYCVASGVGGAVACRPVVPPATPDGVITVRVQPDG